MNIIDAVIKEAKWIKVGQNFESYETLNDAESLRPSLAKGSTEIWYMNKEGWKLYGAHFGKVKEGEKIDLKKTHGLLGKIKETDKEKIFEALNFWSPEGNANNMLRSLGLVHTSMSVGDIAKIGDRYWMVAGTGWTDVTDNIVTEKTAAFLKRPYIHIHPAELVTEELEQKLARSLDIVGNFYVNFDDSAVYFENAMDALKVFPEFVKELGKDHVELIK